MREPNNIRAISQTGITWMGMIFWPKSSRYVSDLTVASAIPEGITRVGVFVNQPLEEIANIAKTCRLDIIQLHGSETADYIRQLRPMLHDGCKIMKAISVSNADDIKKAADYDSATFPPIADIILFDTKCKTVGGSGRQFDWTVLDGYNGELPFLLSGGIGPDDYERIASFHHPKMIGIDLNSRFELAPAIKDAPAISSFIKKFPPYTRLHPPTPTYTHLQKKLVMNKINELFANRGDKKLLSLYFCSGCPKLDCTGEVIKTMERRGIDFIEVGIPFSDPMADGPVIQDAATTALRNGQTLKNLFAQLSAIKDEVSIPLILMGYLNPIMNYGYDAFFAECVKSGVSGVIIPDLPFKDYLDEIKPMADKYDIRVIMLITPETSEERIRFIDEHTDGFIYMVSSAATTGAQKSFDEAKQEYFRRINAMNLRNPRMIGFGISNKQTLESAQANAAGAIIGSKFVTLLKEADGDADKALDRLFAALAE